MTPCPDCERYKTAWDLVMADLIQRDWELLAAKEWLGDLFGKHLVDKEIKERVEKLSKVD